MRWNKTCTLVAKDYELDEEGSPIPLETRTEVFCNEYTVGANTWSSMYEIGISAVVELQVRTCDYNGERDVLYGDQWYTVERVITKGDNLRLVMRHLLSDSEEDDG